MSQFKNLFNTSRVPQEDKDLLHYEPSARHMVVLHKGNFYKFDVVEENGKCNSGDEPPAVSRKFTSHVMIISNYFSPVF